MKSKTFFGTALLLSLIATTSAYAESQSTFNFGLGVYDAFHESDSVDLRAEFRSGKSVIFQNLHPYAGLEITTSGSTWVGAGFFYDYNFAPQWYLTPSLGAGIYHHGEDDVDLDYPVQIRTQLDIGYEFNNEQRMGLYISHTSNAGFGDHNPGTEAVGISWQIPLNTIFK